MSELFEGLFEAIGDLAGEAVGKVAEMAAEAAGAALEGAAGAAGAVAEGAGPVLANAASEAGHLAGAAAQGVAMAAGEGLVEGAIDVVGTAMPLPGLSDSPNASDVSAARKGAPSQGQTRVVGRPEPQIETPAEVG